MPVILKEENEATWLTNNESGCLHDLLVPYPANELQFHPVSKAVNTVVNNYPELIEAV